MTLEKLEAFVGIMTNDQYERFQAAVLNLLQENGIFTSDEIMYMEQKAQLKHKKATTVTKKEYGFTMMNVPTN